MGEATLKYNKKKCYGGQFDNEEHAAMKVNLLCDEYETERQNPTIEIKPEIIQQSNKTSKYAGVCWNTNAKKWQVQFVHNKHLYYGGLFDNEEHAAMKVNLLCDKYETERRNPMITIKPNVIHQVTVKEIKVEDKNILHGFKDECE